MTTATETTKRDIATTVDATAGTLQLVFSNDNVLTIDIAQLNASIVNHAILHGLKQKLVDAAAISRNPVTGGTADIEDKYNAVKEVFDRITGENPQWNKNRETGSGGGVSGGLLLRALIRLYPTKSADDLKKYVDSKTKQEQAALRGNPKIAAMIDTIRAEKSGGVNSDDLLAELDV